MKRRPMISGVEAVPTANGIGRLQYSAPKFHDGDTIDLTLPIGSYGEEITIRRLEVASRRRSQYSGRLEYKLTDHAHNRIDDTRWFQESTLTEHDSSVPDPVCKRVSKRGLRCTSTPTNPAGLCIMHKAKLDWDREKQRRKLEAELSQRTSEKKVTKGFSQQSIPVTVQPVKNSTQTNQRRDSEATTLVDDGSNGVAISMWGDVELFAAVTRDASFGPGEETSTESSQWRTCVILIVLCASTVLLSLSIALWWSLTRGDVSGGFTMAGYIVAIGGVVMYPIQSQHSKHCRCWHRLRRARTI